jgi:hypothetical protein
MEEDRDDPGNAAESAEDAGAAELPSTPLARRDVVSRQVDGEWVLYDPASEKMHVLNATAGAVWHQLDGTRTLDELVSGTRNAFDAPPPMEVVRRDVHQVLRQFAAEGLLT